MILVWRTYRNNVGMIWIEKEFIVIFLLEFICIIISLSRDVVKAKQLSIPNRGIERYLNYFDDS